MISPESAAAAVNSIVTIIGVLLLDDSYPQHPPDAAGRWLWSALCCCVTPEVSDRQVPASFFVKQQQALGKVNGYIEEMMNGQKVVKVFCHEEAASQGVRRTQR